MCDSNEDTDGKFLRMLAWVSIASLGLWGVIGWAAWRAVCALAGWL